MRINLGYSPSGAVANINLDTLPQLVPKAGRSVQAAPTYLLNNLGQCFNPMDFANAGGALAGGDDATDDRVAIQAALAAADAVTPKGTVIVTKRHVVSASGNVVPGASGNYALLIPSGVSLMAGSAQAQIRCTTDGATIIAGAGASSAAHVTDVVVQGLKLIGGDTTNNGLGRAVFFFRADRCHVRFLDVSGVRLGVQYDRNSGDAAYNKGCSILSTTVRDTFGTASGNGTAFFLSGVDGFVCTDIKALNVAEHGLYISQDVRNVAVNGAVLQPANNTNQNCGVQVFTAVAVPNIKNLSFVGLSIVGGKWGFLASAAGGGKIKKLSLTGGSISDCLTAGVILSNVVNATLNGLPVEGTTAGSGIECDNCRSIKLNGCDSTLNFGYGALFVDSPNCSVTGGDYNNNDTGLNGNAGIRFAFSASGSTGGRVTGARCTDDQAVKTQALGIQIDVQSTNCTIADTDVSGNRLGSIQHNNAVGTDIRNCRGYNPGGPSAVVVTASPMPYTAGMSPEVLSIMGGTVTSVVKNGVVIATSTNQQITLMPGQSVTITYTVAPTMAKDIQ
jgi:hypothetical protein